MSALFVFVFVSSGVGSRTIVWAPAVNV
jgi:hypothetical protein